MNHLSDDGLGGTLPVIRNDGLLFIRVLYSPLNGLHNVLVAGAAAKISLESVPDVFLGRVRIAGEQLMRSHNHTRRAEPALQSMLLPESLLEGVEIAVGAQRLDGSYFRAVGLDGKKGAGLDCITVQKHRTRSAQRSLAADVGTRKARNFP
jgi:hypothetical protein